jgi:ATP/ADP translocase
MQKLFSQVFRVQPGEEKLILSLGLLLFGNAMVRQITGIVSISGFLSTGGVNQILFVMLIDYALVILVTALQSLIIDRFNRVRLMAGVNLAFLLIFVVVRVLFALNAPAWLNYAFLYILAEQQLIFFPLIFWVLASDATNMAQSKRLFPLISSWGVAGKLLGIGVAIVSPALFRLWGLKPEDLIFLSILIYLLLFVLSVTSFKNVNFRSVNQRTQSIRESLNEGWEFVRNVPSFYYFLLAIGFVAIGITVVEFRFIVVSNSAFPTQADYQQFYSLYRLAIAVLSIIIQSVFTNKLITAIKLRNVFVLLPALTLIGAALVLVFPQLAVAVLSLGLLRLTRETIDEPASYSLLALVPEERRGRVSSLLNSYIPALGVVAACLVVGIIVFVGDLFHYDTRFIYLGLTVACAVASLTFILKMRSVYDKSLLDWRLKRRQRTSSVLDKLDL